MNFEKAVPLTLVFEVGYADSIGLSSDKGSREVTLMTFRKNIKVPCNTDVCAACLFVANLLALIFSVQIRVCFDD